MNVKLKRVLMGAVVAIIATLLAPLMGAAPAFATGSLQGAATIRNAGGAAALQSGNGGTTFTLRLPSGASCPGDSANSNYHWDTYMVPASVNPNSLQFASTGPTPSGTGASFSQPLYDLNGTPVVNQQTANQTTANGPGAIINIPDMNFQVFTDGQIPSGVYNLGIACILGPASSTQENSYWNVQMTVTYTTGTAGPSNTAGITWQNGTLPPAPTAGAVTPSDGQLTVAFTEPAGANPAVTGFTATANPGAITGTAAANATSVTITGLTNLTNYTVTIHATNAVGNSAESNQVSGTPGKPAVTGLAGVPAPNRVDLTWNAPSPAPASYTIDRCTGDATGTGGCTGTSPGFGTQSSATPSASVTGLTPGQLYTFTVYYPQSFKASTTATPLSNAILMQDVTVTRPAGSLVITQVCGTYGNVPAEGASTGFPTGFAANAPAGNASGNTPHGPFTDNGSGQATTTVDPNYPANYPAPANPTYPTHCSLDLGTAQFVTSGAGAGQFFSSSGRLNEVTVTDSRDTDPGWTLSMAMGSFSAGPGKTMSGNQLGWTNASTQTPTYTDGNGNPYSQTVANDPAVAPNTSGSGGAGTSHPVAHAAAGAGLGTATVDARIKILIPLNVRNGTYAGTLTITAA